MLPICSAAQDGGGQQSAFDTAMSQPCHAWSAHTGGDCSLARTSCTHLVTPAWVPFEGAGALTGAGSAGLVASLTPFFQRSPTLSSPPYDTSCLFSLLAYSGSTEAALASTSHSTSKPDLPPRPGELADKNAWSVKLRHGRASGSPVDKSVALVDALRVG